MRSAVSEGSGREVGTQGDSFFCAFHRAADALVAAAATQRAFGSHEWPAGRKPRVRMGIHTGEASVLDDDYLGLAVHRAARICAAAHGGQVLLSQTTRDVAEEELPAELALRELGEQRLKDLERPERLFQLEVEGLPVEFPPPRTAGPVPAAAESPGGTFVGRERELDELIAGLEAALSGRGRLFLLVGEPGIGKSRLADEAIARGRAARCAHPRGPLLGGGRRPGVLALGAVAPHAGPRDRSRRAALAARGRRVGPGPDRARAA